MQTIKSYLENFFEFNIKNLNEKHAGLTSKRLILEIETLEGMLVGFNNKKEWMSSPWLFGLAHPIHLFLHNILEGVPLQYASGKTSFYGLDYLVNSDVLIPRPETERLIEIALAYLQKKFPLENTNSLKVLDLGTGSGAIIIALMSFLPITACATDLSMKALKMAEKNYYKLQYSLHPDSKITFKQSNLFQGIEDSFDLIISNPPYVKKIADQALVHPQVSRYEPEMAVFLSDDSYELWFEQFFNGSINHLISGGLLLMEGSEQHLGILKLMALQKGFVQVELMKDLTGSLRYLKASKG